MAFKDHAYSQTPLDIMILVDDVDITTYVADVPSLSKSTDATHDFGEYRVGETTLLINDPTGYFSPQNESNFFVDRMKAQSGLGVKVEVKAKYGTDAFSTIFIGEVIECDYNMDDETAESRIVAADTFHKLFTEPITDFGLTKQFMIPESTEETDLHGNYPIPAAVRPPSDASVTVKKSVSDTLTEVSEIAERGALDESVYQVDDDAIKTEAPITNASTGYPQIEMKAPYRNIPVESVIAKVLSEVGITNSQVVIPKVETSDHFKSVGRIGYEVIGTALLGTGNPLSWLGYPTDFIYDTGVFYYLYSGVRGKSGRSMLLAYTESTDVWQVLWRAAVVTDATTEVWALAKNGNDIAILCTDAGVQESGDGALPDVSVPASGSYNATETGNRVYIIKRDITLPVSNASITTLVAKNATIKAQLAHYYALGETYSDPRAPDAPASVPAQSPPRMLPNSRRRILWYNNELYFVGVDADDVGVAKIASSGGTPTWVTNIKQDGVNNQASVFLDIIGSRLYVVGSYRETDRSRLLAWSHNL